MTINVPLLRKTVEWVEEQEKLDPLTNPERIWNQQHWYWEQSFGCELDNWSCNSVMCIAGKIAIDAGWEPEGESMMSRDDLMLPAAHIASLELGLSNSQATRLFDGDNNAESIRRIAEEIAGERL